MFMAVVASILETNPRYTNLIRALRPRMETLMHFLETRLIHVRVDLRRCDAGVPEHLLNLTQVRPAGQQMRGEAVSQSVWTDRGGYAGP